MVQIIEKRFKSPQVIRSLYKLDELIIPLPATQIAGRFMVEATKPDGRKRVVHPWQDNLVTDAGLDNMGIQSGGWQSYCSLGTGTTPEQFTDTAMDVFKAKVGRLGYPNYTEGKVALIPDVHYYSYQRDKYRFAQGTAAGTITEIGVGPNAGSISTRALVRDSNGDPTFFIVTADEQLDVTYEIQAHVPDVTFIDSQHTINGVLYDMKRGPSKVLDTNNMNGRFSIGAGINSMYVYRGTPTTMPNIGTYLTSPTGSIDNKTFYKDAYVPGNHYHDGYVFCAYTDSPGTKGVTAVWTSGYMQHYQISITQNLADPLFGIPKDNTNELTIWVRGNWSRYTPP